MEMLEWSLLTRPCFWKIIRVLVRENEVNISHLLHATRLNYTVLRKCLRDMENAGIVKVYRIARLRVVVLNWRHYTIPALYDLVRAIDGRLKVGESGSEGEEGSLFRQV